MYGKITIIILLMAIFSPFFGVCGAELKIATIDLQRIFKEYYKAKIFESALRDQGERFNVQIKEAQTQIQTLEDEFKVARDSSQNLALTAEARSKHAAVAQDKYAEIVGRREELALYSARRSEELDKVMREKREELFREIQVEISKRAQSEGFDLIIDSSRKGAGDLPTVLFAKAPLDMSDRVIRDLNRGHSSAPLLAPPPIGGPALPLEKKSE